MTIVDEILSFLQTSYFSTANRDPHHTREEEEEEEEEEETWLCEKLEAREMPQVARDTTTNKQKLETASVRFA